MRYTNDNHWAEFPDHADDQWIIDSTSELYGWLEYDAPHILSVSERLTFQQFERMYWIICSAYKDQISDKKLLFKYIKEHTKE